MGLVTFEIQVSTLKKKFYSCSLRIESYIDLHFSTYFVICVPEIWSCLMNVMAALLKNLL